MQYTGAPLKLPFVCTDDDLQWAGLSCVDDACPVYVELSRAAGSGKTILITGNLHAAAATLFSLVLRSDDGGRTWREPFARIRGAELDRIQMYDSQTGWVAGQVQQPLALDPFFLLTSDGGKSWERVAMFEEGTPGAILQFAFDSREHGLVMVNRGGGEMRYEVYETQSGGHSWSIRQTSEKPPPFKAPPESEWRVRPEAKLYRLEHQEDGRWNPFASFAVPVAQCKEQPRAEPVEPKPVTDLTGGQPAVSPDDAVSEIHLGAADGKAAKKSKGSKKRDSKKADAPLP